jgi:hypothetical protein
MHVYEVRPRSDKRGVDLVSDALPFRSERHEIDWKMQSNYSSAEAANRGDEELSQEFVRYVFDAGRDTCPYFAEGVRITTQSSFDFPINNERRVFSRAGVPLGRYPAGGCYAQHPC